MKRSHINKLLQTLKDQDTLLIKLLLECWNDNTPHFGGDGPHRYDGSSKSCSYCNRPIDWKPVNPGVIANDLVYGDLVKVKGA